MSAVATAAALIFSAHLVMMDCGERAGGEGCSGDTVAGVACLHSLCTRSICLIMSGAATVNASQRLPS